LRSETWDTLIIGAGAAGMMCAAYAGSGGRSVLVADHAKVSGEKIRISGGGRCNFTNLNTSASNFISANGHFAKSALARYTPRDFIDLVERHRIAWHEKTLGQLFCDESANQIIAMLQAEMAAAGAVLRLRTHIRSIRHDGSRFEVMTETDGLQALITCRHVVIATGGKSIPKIGASGFAYDVAAQFGLSVTETRPALVPLTFGPDVMERLRALAGIAAPAIVSCGRTSFKEAVLFTHRGLSGPAVLQISSYWRESQSIELRLIPDIDVLAHLKQERSRSGRQIIASALAGVLPKRLADHIADGAGLQATLADAGDKLLERAAAAVQSWRLTPAGSEGYRTAEVTLGGIDTAGLDSRTMEARTQAGLFFIGEAVDVTGWLGGYNFQWAWASAVACGRAVAER
jgi:predicted Rossmann fold flavoprotein